MTLRRAGSFGPLTHPRYIDVLLPRPAAAGMSSDVGLSVDATPELLPAGEGVPPPSLLLSSPGRVVVPVTRPRGASGASVTELLVRVPDVPPAAAPLASTATGSTFASTEPGVGSLTPALVPHARSTPFTHAPLRAAAAPSAADGHTVRGMPPAPLPSAPPAAAAAAAAAGSNPWHHQYHVSVVDTVDYEEAADLVSGLINPDVSQRIAPAEALAHPFFWSTARKFLFLQTVSESTVVNGDRAVGRHAAFAADLQTRFLARLPPGATTWAELFPPPAALGPDGWRSALWHNKGPEEYERNYYGPYNMYALLRFVRNFYVHGPEHLRMRLFQSLPHLQAYLLSAWPWLVIEVYRVDQMHGGKYTTLTLAGGNGAVATLAGGGVDADIDAVNMGGNVAATLVAAPSTSDLPGVVGSGGSSAAASPAGDDDDDRGHGGGRDDDDGGGWGRGGGRGGGRWGRPHVGGPLARTRGPPPPPIHGGDDDGDASDSGGGGMLPLPSEVPVHPRSPLAPPPPTSHGPPSSGGGGGGAGGASSGGRSRPRRDSFVLRAEDLEASLFAAAAARGRRGSGDGSGTEWDAGDDSDTGGDRVSSRPLRDRAPAHTGYPGPAYVAPGAEGDLAGGPRRPPVSHRPPHYSHAPPRRADRADDYIGTYEASEDEHDLVRSRTRYHGPGGTHDTRWTRA